MKKYLFLLILLLICLNFPWPGNAEDNYLTAKIKNLSNRQYYKETLAQINKAEKSIFLVMYMVSFNPAKEDDKVLKLLNALVKARKRRVKIKVILEYHVKKDFKKGKVSYQTYLYLRQKGIKDVYFDTLKTTTHSKVLVIDEKTVILGSTNWTKSALEKNNETSLLVESSKLAKELITNIEKIKTSTPLFLDENNSVLVPLKFLDEKIAGNMLSAPDKRAFHTYLLCLKHKSSGRPSSPTYEYLAKKLGISKKMKETAYRRQINKVLRKLEKKYKLIDVTLTFNKPLKLNVKMLGGESFFLPNTYWKYGWDKVLSFKAKIALLITLREIYRNNFIPEWSLSQKTLSEKYSLSEDSLEKGLKELRNFNLIDIQHPIVKQKKYSQREPNIYYFLDFYSLKDFKQKILSLEKKYGKDKVTLFRSLASIVSKKYSLPAIKKIQALIDKHGEDKITNIFAKIKQKKPDNPQRTLDYVIKLAEK
jgi:cardiolipin synthase